MTVETQPTSAIDDGWTQRPAKPRSRAEASVEGLATFSGRMEGRNNKNPSLGVSARTRFSRTRQPWLHKAIERECEGLRAKQRCRGGFTDTAM